MLQLAPVEHADRDTLLAFELENRVFFEANINPRAPTFYSIDGVTQAIQAAIDDVAADRGYQFLVKSSGGAILGRINLRELARGPDPSATLGYRIAAAHGGKGYASAAVRALLDIAFGPLGLLRVDAGARVSNVGSVRVLQRNGFKELGRSPGSLQLGGVWHDRLHFARHAD